MFFKKMFIIVSITMFFIVNYENKEFIMIDNEIKMCDNYLKIDKINMMLCLYDIDSKENDLKYNIQIYHEEPLVILGHSGNRSNAYFNDLKYLDTGDLVEIKYKDIIELYKINKKYNKKKKDLLHLEDDLILVTCDLKIKDEQIVLVSNKV